MNPYLTRTIVFIGAACFVMGCYSEDEFVDVLETDSQSTSEGDTKEDTEEGTDEGTEEDTEEKDTEEETTEERSTDTETETDTEMNTDQCTENIHCSDGSLCNGDEICDDGECKSGSLDGHLADGTNCGAYKECFDGICLDFDCGDGNVSSNEDCDDGNDVAHDGCESDCTWTCTQALDCDDSIVCNGAETCEQHICQAGTPPDCNDDNHCTTDSCDNGVVGGCVYTLIDNDSDGHAASDLGNCGSYNGDDCNDNDHDIHPGNTEVCDFKDNNCSGNVDDITDATLPNAIKWYEDCDGDGHSPSQTATLKCFLEPTENNCGSQAGWTDNAPGSKTDCHDGNADVFPGQTEYFYRDVPGTNSMDYNCDGDETAPFSFIITSCSNSECDAGRIGWKQSVPLCGALGPRVKCEWDGIFCMTNEESSAFSSCH